MSAWSEYADRFGLTKCEAKLFAALTDGQPHTADNLMVPVTGRQFGAVNTIAVHVMRMRPKIAGAGFSVESNRRGSPGYRLVGPGIPS